MKLRNKRTGEIRELPDGFFCGDNLKKICEEWEDYEEPKEYWYLENNGEVVRTTFEGNLYEERMIEIGNYFETKEEAEKAGERLRAWKRLKDTYYIRFDLDFVKNTISFTYRIDGTLHSAVDEERIVFEDMETIFGGEE